MTMQIKAERFGKRNRIRITVTKQDNEGNKMSVGKHTTDDVRIARALLDSTLKLNKNVGKVRIKWEI
jgi:hypothetical protein